MTFSQRIAQIATIAATIGGIATVVAPYTDLLPEKLKPVGTVVAATVAISGAIVTAYNQSLSKGHISLPVFKAEEIAAIPERKAIELGLMTLKTEVEKRLDYQVQK